MPLAATFAALSAGPLFIGFAILAGYIAAIPGPVPISSHDLTAMAPVLLASLIGGFVLAVVPICVGGGLMIAAGALVLTTTICALICRRHIGWPDQG